MSKAPSQKNENNHFKRVAVLGPPGSGKSTFSLKFAEKTGLPVFHMDKYYLEKPEYWNEHHDEWHQFCLDLIDKDRWIIDGNYSATFEDKFKRADLIVYLDMGRLASYDGIIRRRIKYNNKKRPGMPDDWREKLNFGFMKFVWKFHGDKTQNIRILLEEHSHKDIKVFHSRQEANRYIEGIR